MFLHRMTPLLAGFLCLLSVSGSAQTPAVLFQDGFETPHSNHVSSPPVVLFQDGFEGGTVGHAASSPLVGSYILSGTNASSTLEVLTGKAPGTNGPYGAREGSKYAYVKGGVLAQALFKTPLYAQGSPFRISFYKWRPGTNGFPQMIVGNGTAVNGLTQLLYTTDWAGAMEWRWYADTYRLSGMAFSANRWELVEIEWDGSNATGRIDGRQEGRLGLWQPVDKLLDRLLFRSSSGPADFYIDDIKVTTTAPVLPGSAQPTISNDPTERHIPAGQRELFVDSFLIDSMYGARMCLHEPHDEGSVLSFDNPWEGGFSGYCTVLPDAGRYRLYYRGLSEATDGVGEVVCIAESADGVNWIKPALGLVEAGGSRSNNIILAAENLCHNFSPFADSNPASTPSQRYKALAGMMHTGLFALGSPDGVRWSKMRQDAVFLPSQLPGPNGFDSQNVAFWSESEKRYLMYFRVNVGQSVRRIGRAESHDFIHWTNSVLMDYKWAKGQPPVFDHLYINQTHPYFRAPHIYIGLAARFVLGRQVISDEEAEKIGVHPSYFKDTSDVVLLSSRGGGSYDRTFLSSFVRPGIGPRNWVSRTTYAALNVVQTGPNEMSLYANQDYAQPTAHVRRYSLRLDGFASVQAPFQGGEFVTHPFSFDGSRLLINFSTSAAGAVRVEILNAQGQAIPGFALSDCVELVGNEIEREVRWNGSSTLSALTGQKIRLRVFLKDADLYSFRFANEE